MADPTIEKIVASVKGRPVEVRRVERQPLRFSTAFPTEIVSITLEDGETVSLFVKQLGQEQSDHPDKQQRDRELQVYGRLFKGGLHPVPRYYGNEWNAQTQRWDLYFEYIDGWKLKHCDMNTWFLAAEKLGALHGYFMNRGEVLQSAEFLLQLDSRYFLTWAERAIQSLVGFPLRVQENLRAIAARYDVIASLLASQPPTLVHNDLAPKNVVVDRGVKPDRICFVDWELAGRGCGLLDLVYLKYKLDPETGARMVGHYCSALASTFGSAPGGRELHILLAACELHRRIYRIARREAWNITEKDTIQSVAEAQQWFDSTL